MNTYKDTISFWDNIFDNEKPNNAIQTIQMLEDLEEAISWLCKNSKSIIDYGCGKGTMLFKCTVHNNIRNCLGIDISQKAVDLGTETAILNNLHDKVKLGCGEVSALEEIKENSFDGAILSNIIDNITPDDTKTLIQNISRIVVPNGKILVRLNPYLEQEQIKESRLKLISNNLYLENEGIFLRNLTTPQWAELLKQYFTVAKYKDIYFEQFDQFNRLFLLTNN